MATTTANKIIDNAYEIIGIKAEDRNLSGGQLAKGLELLNSLLDDFASSTELIAYDSLLTFPLVIGQTTYVIKTSGGDVTSNQLAKLKYIILVDGDLQYPIAIVEDAIFYNSRRSLEIGGLPQQAFFQNGINESTIQFLRKPDKTYQCTVKGKFVLTNLTLNTTITNIPEYYNLFLQLSLGRILKGRYPGSTWDQTTEAEYTQRKNNLTSTSDTNLNSVTGTALLHNNIGGSNTIFDY
jgi:hypothetical protein